MVGGKWLHLIGYLVKYLTKVALHVLHDHEQVGELKARVLRVVIILANDYVIQFGRELVRLHLGEVPQYLNFTYDLTYLVGTRKDVFH